jgi:hypothetical protein
MVLEIPSMKPIRGAFVSVLLVLSTELNAAGKAELRRDGDRVVLAREGKEVFTYNLRPPAHSGLPVEAGSYFHPLRTPSGVVVTDFVPSDHRHHRGLFLAWVETHGAKDADFWGWGALAPIQNRQIVNRAFESRRDGFRARNDWVADGQVILEETLTTSVRQVGGMNVLDLDHRFVPAADTTLSRVAFSGFCLRVRKDGDLRFLDASGPVERANPVYNQPASDWPDARWYAAEQTLPDGQHIGAAVFNHPSNPATLWHNHRDVRMINPCIVAPGPVSLKKGRTLHLRYRVATFDGPAPVKALNQLAGDWR